MQYQNLPEDYEYDVDMSNPQQINTREYPPIHLKNFDINEDIRLYVEKYNPDEETLRTIVCNMIVKILGIYTVICTIFLIIQIVCSGFTIYFLTDRPCPKFSIVFSIITLAIGPNPIMFGGVCVFMLCRAKIEFTTSVKVRRVILLSIGVISLILGITGIVCYFIMSNDNKTPTETSSSA